MICAESIDFSFFLTILLVTMSHLFIFVRVIILEEEKNDNQ